MRVGRICLTILSYDVWLIATQVTKLNIHYSWTRHMETIQKTMWSCEGYVKSIHVECQRYHDQDHRIESVNRSMVAWYPEFLLSEGIMIYLKWSLPSYSYTYSIWRDFAPPILFPCLLCVHSIQDGFSGYSTEKWWPKLQIVHEHSIWYRRM